MSYFENLFNAIFGRTKSVDNQNRYYLPLSSRSPEYQGAVEEHLRRAGMTIENRSSAFPTLEADQFTRDVGATMRGRRDDPLQGPKHLQ
jgi:hypothetical protein